MPTENRPEQHRPGRTMSAEMAQQPAVLRRILADGAPQIHRTADLIAARKPRFVLLTARGTSDNAALYAKYLIEVLLGMPAGLTSMSTTTAYGAQQDLTDVLVVTVSQSGGSPDLVASTRAAREAGAITLAVTNNPGSPSPRSPSSTSTSWPVRRRRSRPPRRTPPSCCRCTCSSTVFATGRSPGAPPSPRSCRTSPSGSSPGRPTWPGWPRGTASPSG